MDLFELSAVLTLDTSQYEQNINNAENRANILSGGLKTGAAAFAAVGTAIVGTGVAIAKGTGKLATYGDNIDKMSQKMGISAQAYQEWDAIMRHSGTSIDSMQRGMTTLSKAAENNSDAFKALGISQEEIASMNQEELFARTIAGLQGMRSGTERTVLAQQLLGGSAKELGALLNMSAEETQEMRDRVHELGGVMSDDAVAAAARYQDSLQDMQTAFSGISRGLLSDFMPSIATVMDGLTEIFSGDSEKGVGMVTEGVSQMLENFETALPQLAEIGSSIFSAIGEAITENLPLIVENGTQIVINLVSGIISSLPNVASAMFTMITTMVSTIIENLSSFGDVATQIVGSLSSSIDSDSGLSKMLDAGLNLVSSVVSGILDGLPDIITTGGTIAEDLLNKLLEYLPQLMTRGSEFILHVVSGIAQKLPAIVASATIIMSNLTSTIMEKLPDVLQKGVEIIGKLVKGIVQTIPDVVSSIAGAMADLLAEIGENLPDFLQKGIEIIGKVLAGIIEAVPDILAEIPGILSDIASKFTSYDWGSIGHNIISGIANGIKNAAKNIIDAAKSAAQSAFEAAKRKLGIESPSKLFRDKIGKMISAGWALGIEDGGDDVLHAIGNLNDDMANGLDDVDYATTMTVSRSGSSDKESDTYYLMRAVEDLAGLMADMDEGLTEKLLDAFSQMRFTISGREFGRLVRDVRTA